jgi:type IV secretory pathway VirB6-like protein
MEKTKKALRFIKFFFPIAKAILLVTLTLGLVLRMTGMECLTDDTPNNRVLSTVAVEADGNYSVVVTPATTTYNSVKHYAMVLAGMQGGGELAVTTTPETRVKNATKDASGNFKYYGMWVKGGRKIGAGKEYSITTTGTVNMCSSEAVGKVYAINANSAGWTSTTTDGEQIYIKPGDIVNIAIVTDVDGKGTWVAKTETASSVAGAGGNKWALSTIDQTALSQNYSGNISGGYWDGDNVVKYILPDALPDGRLCTAAKPSVPALYSYPKRCYAVGSCSIGPIWCGVAHRTCRTLLGGGPSQAADPCWNINGDGLMGRVGDTPIGIAPAGSTVINVAADPTVIAAQTALGQKESEEGEAEEEATLAIMGLTQAEATQAERTDAVLGAITALTSLIADTTINTTIRTVTLTNSKNVLEDWKQQVGGDTADPDKPLTQAQIDAADAALNEAVTALSAADQAVSALAYETIPTAAQQAEQDKNIAAIKNANTKIIALKNKKQATAQARLALENAKTAAMSANPKYINDLLNPTTREYNLVQSAIPGGGTPAKNSDLPEEQQSSNYYGYYMGKSTYEGLLSFKINAAATTTSSNSGGYTVIVTKQPKGCTANNGMPVIVNYNSATNVTTYDPNGIGKMMVKFVAEGKDPNDRDADGNVRTADAGTDITLVDGRAPAEPPVTTPPTIAQPMVAPYDGYLWFKVYDKNEPPYAGSDPNYTYAENSGTYSANISTYYVGSGISDMIDGVRIPLRDTLNKVVADSFNNLVHDGNFAKAIRALVTLYLIFYFAMYLMGMVQLSQMDFVIRMVKVSVVLGLIAPGSWDFFHDHFLNLYMDGGTTLLSNMTGGIGDKDHPFLFLDKTIGVFFQQSTMARVLALFMVFPLGWFFAVLIFLGMWTYIVAVAKAVLSYLVSLVLVAMLLTMAPIFLSFILFAQTKSIFDTWVRLLFRYTFEPIMLLLGLTILNELLVIALHGVLGNPACWKCAITFNIPGYGDLFCFYFYMPWGYNATLTMVGLDFGAQLFAAVAMFEIITALALDFSNLMPRVSATLTGTSAITGINLTGDVLAVSYPNATPGRMAAESISDKALAMVGRDKESIARRKHDKVIKEKIKKDSPFDGPHDE